MKKEILVRILASLALICMILPMLAFCVRADGGGASADIFKSNIPKAPDMNGVAGAYVYNVDNSTEVLAYNGENRIYPASLVKVAAFALASEKLSGRLDEKVTVTQQMLSGTVGTYIGIEAGETFTVKELFYIAFCGCFNDAVNIIANVCSGSVSAFVAEMNLKASQLGATGTVFTNPTGIHNNGMYSTMSDLGKILLDASRDPLVMQITSTSKIELEKSEDHDRYMIYNRNMLISDRTTAKYINPCANGLNAGSTVESGECVATIAKKEGLSYLCIVVGGKAQVTDDGEKYITSYKLINELIDWSFESFGYVKLFDSSVPCADLSVKYGIDVDVVSVVPDGEIIMYLPLSFDVESKLDYRMRFDKPEFEAPLKKGDTVGRMTVLYEGEPLGEVSLKLTKDVEKDTFLYTLDSIKAFSQNRVFLLTVACAIGYTVLFTVCAALLRRFGGGKKKKKNNSLR